MKIALFMAIVIAFTGSTAFAGVAEKKAQAKADKSISEGQQSVKSKCGKDIKVEFKHEDAAKIKVDGRDAANVIGVAGSLCGTVLSFLGEMCSDNDYKEEIVKLTLIKCVPTDMKKSPYVSAKKDGTTLEVKHHPVMNDLNTMAILKAAF
jgi:hypothetical protein